MSDIPKKPQRVVRVDGSTTIIEWDETMAEVVVKREPAGFTWEVRRDA